jgi:hypothetical protein
MIAFSKPSEADQQNVSRYIDNRNCLIDGEAAWILHRDDLIALRAGREQAWLDGMVESILRWYYCPLVTTIFRSEVGSPLQHTRKTTEIDSTPVPGDPPPNPADYEVYYKSSRVAKLTNGTLHSSPFCCLSCPYTFCTTWCTILAVGKLT